MPSAPSPRTVFAPPPFVRLMIGLCALFMGCFNVLALVALVMEGPKPGVLVALGTLAVFNLLTLVVAVQTFRRAVLTADHIEYGLPLISRRVGLHEIQRVEHASAVLLHTASGVHRVKLGTRDPQAELFQALQRVLPEHAGLTVASLPFTWRPRQEVILTNLAMTLVFGPGFLVMGLGAGAVGVRSALHGEWVDAAGAGLALLVMGALGVLMTGMFLWSFRWKVEFSADSIIEVCPVRRRHFDTDDMLDIVVDGEIRKHKGRSREAWWLAVRFAGDRDIRIEPTENGVATAQNAKADRLELEGLCQDLRRLYGLVKAPKNSPLMDILDELRAMAPREQAHAFETVRDRINRLKAPDAVLQAARSADNADVLELLATCLADVNHAAAMPDMVRWLDHDEEQIRFVAAMALDSFSGKRFGVDGCIDGGWVQHDQIRAKAPALRQWWTAEGQALAARRAR